MPVLVRLIAAARSSLLAGVIIVTPLTLGLTPACGSAPSGAGEPGAVSSSCCRICVTGKACGGSCIAKTATCNQPTGCACNGPSDVTTPQSQGGAYKSGSATGDTQEGAAFARWVLDQDPQSQYITDAVVRGDQVLGVRVRSTATRGEIHDLLVALTQGMNRQFPNRVLKVVAYYQTGDQLAEADFDPRTNTIDVTFAQ
jgi:hypothetical protein